MFSRGKLLVQISLKANEDKFQSNSETKRGFMIKDGKINEASENTTTNLSCENSETKSALIFTIENGKINGTKLSTSEYTATKLSCENFEHVPQPSTSQENVESVALVQNIPNLFTKDLPSSALNQVVWPEHENLSDSDITVDYDDELRDPNWKYPNKNHSSGTDENNNVSQEIDHEEVVQNKSFEKKT